MRDLHRLRGRGALSTREGRFEARSCSAFDDGWGTLDDDEPGRPRTHVQPEHPRRIVTRNQSPDVNFDRSINPYQGCEHGCIYCYARPSHAYHGLGAGLDFETRIFSKPTAPDLLRADLRRPGYVPDTIVVGANTDPYQPVERRLGITRGVLEVLDSFRHPVGIITKGAGIRRDLDVLSSLNERGLARVCISVTTLDPELSAKLEPRASAPSARLKTIERCAEAGIPVVAMLSPIIPGVNDAEIEALARSVADAGAAVATFILVRLPGEVSDLFGEWLDEHMPLRREHVLTLIRDCRDGKLNDARFGERMRGSGAYAELLRRRMDLARRRYGLDRRLQKLPTSHFRIPPRAGDQLALF